MKIQCDVCERAEATVLCCADEAALCWGCDERVHAANKLAEKHQRVPLFTDPSSSSSKPSSSQIPSCDICQQERTGYFFCLEDRALLCRQCDISIHTASPHVSCHQRFLITGVRVALQQHLTTGGSSKYNTNERSNNSSLGPRSSVSTTTISSTIAVEDAEGFRPQSPWNEMFDTTNDFDLCYHMFSGPGSSN